MAQTWTMERESVEFRAVDVTVDDVAETDFEVAVLAYGERPEEEDWASADQVGSEYGYLTDGSLAVGTYTVWVRVSSAPETPVLQAGLLRVT